jgi:putative FmdB family regulatory protein
MPTYGYRCLSCKHEFEIQRKVSEMLEDAFCPECDSEAQKLISGGLAAFVKGGEKTGDLITEAADHVGAVKESMGFAGEQAAMKRVAGKMQDRARLAGARARREGRSNVRGRRIEHEISIPSHVAAYNMLKDKQYYAGEEGRDRAKKEGFGVE